MFKNPMFEWWLESLENRQLHSSVGSATVETSSPDQNAIEVPLIISTPQRHPGAFATRAPIPELPLTPAEPAPTDEIFVTDWFLSPDTKPK
jgi:hypothetical protein